MIYSKEIARHTARSLLQIKAIKINNTNPFTWSSGWKSPIYCDNRKTLSHQAIRTLLRNDFIRIIKDKFAPVDIIAGVATGGIGIGAIIAQEMGLPFVYVRSKKKGHGLENLVEGDITVGKTVVVVEDLVSTGNSSLNAVNALREADLSVKGMAAIFTYGFDKAQKHFEQENCRLFTLSDYQTAINEALNQKYIEENELASLEHWRQNPDKWPLGR